MQSDPKKADRFCSIWSNEKYKGKVLQIKNLVEFNMVEECLKKLELYSGKYRDLSKIKTQTQINNSGGLISFKSFKGGCLITGLHSETGQTVPGSEICEFNDFVKIVSSLI